jgi:uncharacterized protein YlbG (UPF0298 family)
VFGVCWGVLGEDSKYIYIYVDTKILHKISMHRIVRAVRDLHISQADTSFVCC